ncbi:unnamed protein product, partial [Meganyctiphanes norvegica]
EFFQVDSSTQCFHLYDDKKRTWNEAQTHCHDKGLVVARPTDRTAAALRKYIFVENGNGGVWLNAQGDGEKIVWQEDGTEITSGNPLWWPLLQEKWFSNRYCLLLLAYKSNWKSHPNRPYIIFPCSISHRTLCEGPLLFNSHDAFVNLNEKIQLYCGTRSNYVYCVWEKDNQIIRTEDVYKGMYSGISRPVKTTNNQCGIVLNKATIEDQGIWTCKIYTLETVFVGRKNVTLTVNGIKAPLCYYDCGIDYEWVCGTDKKNYQNRCMLKVAACKAQTNITIKHHGVCEVVKDCPGGFIKIEGSWKCFKVWDDEKRNWWEAEDKCLDENSVLAGPTTEVAVALRKRILDTYGDLGGLWLDGIVPGTGIHTEIRLSVNNTNWLRSHHYPSNEFDLCRAMNINQQFIRNYPNASDVSQLHWCTKRGSTLCEVSL